MLKYYLRRIKHKLFKSRLVIEKITITPEIYAGKIEGSRVRIETNVGSFTSTGSNADEEIGKMIRRANDLHNVIENIIK